MSRSVVLACRLTVSCSHVLACMVLASALQCVSTRVLCGINPAESAVQMPSGQWPAGGLAMLALYSRCGPMACYASSIVLVIGTVTTYAWPSGPYRARLSSQAMAFKQ
jgi:hypothetical protein